MSWFEKLNPRKILWGEGERSPSVPEGLWTKCDFCNSTLYRAELEKLLYVCPKCQHHIRIGARQRLQFFFDEKSYSELDSDITSIDTLKFRDTKKYTDRLVTASKSSKEKEALVSMFGNVKGAPVVAVAFEFRFMGGSMGSVVGEKFVRAVNYAIEKSCPLVCFSASGGARMQESMKSLMQMAKTSAALKKMSEKGLPFISVLTDPTMGGVSASLAMLGDIILAEPKAQIGFAGSRVIEQTVRQTLPEGFQRSEFLLEHGAIDKIVERNDLAQEIYLLITLLAKKNSTNK